jgi:predicted TIM-barrel fold metal-dependent hydrolase
MARQGFKWIDSDMHLAEPADLWGPFMDPRFAEEYRQWTPKDPNFNSLLQPPFSASTGAIPQAEIPANQQSAIKEARFKDYLPYVTPDGGSIGPAGQVKAMEVEGIDVAVLFPTLGLAGLRDAPMAVSMALARAYNDWLHSFCQQQPGRLKLNAVVPLGDPEVAAAEIRRVVTELGAVSIFPITVSEGTALRLDHPRFEPIWAEAERVKVALAFHGSIQVHLKERYRGMEVLTHATGRSVEHPLTFLELLFGGVFERHPELHVAFLEAGCSWVPYWLFRAEEEWERYRKEVPGFSQNVTMEPIHYWRRQCWSAVEVEEWPLRSVVDLIGDDRWVISSDFPHFDSAFPNAFTRFMALEGVSADAKRKILFDNCAALYRIEA